MFVLFDITLDIRMNRQSKELIYTVKELDFFYIIPSMRGYAMGSLVLDEIKEMSRKAGAKLITLQTLHPGINSFYSKNGAHFLCDSRYYDEETGQSHHSSVMTIKL